MSCKGEAVLQLLTATQSFLILSSEEQGPKPGYVSVGEGRKARSKQAFFFPSENTRQGHLSSNQHLTAFYNICK